MAKFDAAEAVEVLEFDFTRYGGMKGVIPEPSTKKVETFNVEMRAFAQEMRDTLSGATGGMDLKALADMKDEDFDEGDLDKVVDAIESIPDDMFSQQQERLSGALGRLCSGTPDQDQLMRLPFRVFTAFNKWIVGEIRPEKGTPATKASRAGR